jgi:sulfite exporter TauE/SafE
LVFESVFPNSLPELTPQTSLLLVFFVGLLTSFHCIAMCGSFVVSYSASEAKNSENSVIESKPGEIQIRKSDLKNHLYYNLGKLVSYTLIGGFFGLIGSVFVFTPQLRGLAAIIAGFFLVLFGLNLLNIFPSLRAVSLPVPKIITKIVLSNRKKGPLVVGLLNGLMIACGPLQAMYLFAASTGSILQGALTMFAFGLGTMPLMFLFGAFVSTVSTQLTQKITRFSGAIVVLLGFFMLLTGFALSGIALPFPNTIAANAASTTILDNNSNASVQEIKMQVNAYGYSPNNFTVKQGVPVKWTINVTQLTGCNNAIIVPALGINKKLVPGIQTIEFTPEKLGTIQFSCWMGMLRGTITVVPAENQNTALKAASQQQYYPQNQGTPKGCGCGAK